MYNIVSLASGTNGIQGRIPDTTQKFEKYKPSALFVRALHIPVTKQLAQDEQERDQANSPYFVLMEAMEEMPVMGSKVQTAQLTLPQLPIICDCSCCCFPAAGALFLLLLPMGTWFRC